VPYGINFRGGVGWGFGLDGGLGLRRQIKPSNIAGAHHVYTPSACPLCATSCHPVQRDFARLLRPDVFERAVNLMIQAFSVSLPKCLAFGNVSGVFYC